jgi:hypothetical protein
MKPSEDLKSYADRMFQDVKDNRNYKAGDVYAVAGYIKRKANEVAQLEEENRTLQEENNHKARYLIMEGQDDEYRSWRDALIAREGE